MQERELKEILDKAARALDVTFSTEAASLIVRMAQGLAQHDLLSAEQSGRVRPLLFTRPHNVRSTWPASSLSSLARKSYAGSH